MTGLRARQKADRNRRILHAASTLFYSEGYRSARIEDMAGMAEVSPGTVYNYYRTKGDLLIAIVAMEVEEVLAAGARIVADPPRGVRRAIETLIWTYYDHSLEYLSKEMWRTVMALSLEAPETPNGALYLDLDRRLAAQVVALVEQLKARGEARSELDAAAIGEVLFNTLNAMFMNFVRDEDMPMGALKARVARQFGLLARLIATGEDR
ncbi:MAG: TetR/AcrR family transcriptional regulator [Rhodobacteraceae bacterium]|nr:TetR/AcrR family transcriptional regulator [Paracoccaceae bacterium]MCP5341195.1 TetR/AcrR family transcriptional regulator [Paracoccaceae bacterium]